MERYAAVDPSGVVSWTTLADLARGTRREAHVTMVHPRSANPNSYDDDGEKGVQVLTWEEFQKGFRQVTYAPTGS